MTTAMAVESIKIGVNEDVLLTFRAAQCFKDFQRNINSMSFSDDGALLVVASDDDTIVTYDCMEGRDKQRVKTKKYGADLVQFAHHNSTVIHASTKIDHAVRFLSLHDNTYKRYFIAHKARVVCVRVNPLDDRILTASLDGTVRLWNINSTNCYGRLCVGEGKPLLAAWDNSGVVFAVAIESKVIKMYDSENFVSGPFATYDSITDTSAALVEWVDLVFSTDGKTMLISTDGEELLLVDAFDPEKPAIRLQGHQNTERHRLIGCFSPDCKYVLCGSEDGYVHIWNASNGEMVSKLSSGLAQPISLVKFNPFYTLFAAVAQEKLLFWIPELKG